MKLLHLRSYLALVAIHVITIIIKFIYYVVVFVLNISVRTLCSYVEW